MGELADDLFNRLEKGTLHPRWREDPLTRDLAKWIALHEGDHDALKAIHPGGWSDDRRYRVDHLPARISSAFADYLYGEDPEISPADDSDTANLEAIVEENDLPQELWNLVDHQSAEGEYYWRIYVDKHTSDVPIIDWHSRSMTVPLFRGARLAAVAFVSEVNTEDEDAQWYYVEVHEPGASHNRLYRQNRPKSEIQKDVLTITGIGEPVGLDQSDDTAGLIEEWRHGLPMLAGRVPNRLGRDKRMGLSDYIKIEDHLFDLNEAHTIDAENYKLAGKKRSVMPERYAKNDGTADTDKDVYFAKEGWEDEMAEGNDGPFKILEYSYNGSESIARKRDLENTTLTRAGLVRQFVTPDSEDGNAASGTALRTRLIPTTLAARGKSRRTDGAVPYMLMLTQMVDALPVEQGGFDRKYAKAAELPAVERGTVLPEDETEKYTRVGLAVSQGLMSLETGLRELHPKWDDDQIKEEARAIQAEQRALPSVDEPAVDEENPEQRNREQDPEGDRA